MTVPSSIVRAIRVCARFRRGGVAVALALAVRWAWAGPSTTGGRPHDAAPKNAAYADTRHGNARTGVYRDPRYARGSCLQCHGGPSYLAGKRGERFQLSLFAAPDRTLCIECHRESMGSYPGAQQFIESSHGNSPPLPQQQVVQKRRLTKIAEEVGGCSSCHDPHGRCDATGLIPSLLVKRGDALCLSCHGNAGPGQDVASLLAASFVHPTSARPVASISSAKARAVASLAPTGRRSAAVAATAVCVDCHNPHLVRHDPSAPIPPAASMDITGVRRVRVTNVPSGPPLLEDLPANDPSFAREYEVCLRCHTGSSVKSSSGAATSGATLSPTGPIDVGVALNPNNASFHPVEAPGKNLGIRPEAFTQPWSADRLVYCGDCHSADGGTVRGPHGSSNEHLLKKRYPPVARLDPPQQTDLCFDCHAYATYAVLGSGMAALATRFDRHAAHAVKGYSCGACHDAHGSITLPALLVLRPQGLTSFTATPNGGTCTTSCHITAPRTAAYRVNYPR